MLAEGKYRACASAAALGVTSTGKDQIAVEFTFLEPMGQKKTWYGFFTDAAFDFTIAALRACGWTGSDLSDFAAGALPDSMTREVEIVIRHQEYQGKVTDRIAFVNAGGGLALKESMSAANVGGFAAKMKARILEFDQRQPGRVPVAPEGKPSGPKLPF